MVGLGAFVMAPFVVMSAWGLSSGSFRPSRLLALPPHGIRWGPMLSVVFWSLEGFDSASTFAGEVDNPSRTYPYAMAMSLTMVTLAYIVPLGVGAGVENSQRNPNPNLTLALTLTPALTLTLTLPRTLILILPLPLTRCRQLT